MFSTLRCGMAALALTAMALPALGESLSFKDARKAVPKGSRTVATLIDTSFLDDKQQAIVKSLEANIPYYGALALTPSEGLFVEWLNAAGQHHSIEAARAAALDHCEANRKRASAPCVVVLEVAPRGAKDGVALSLSAPANEVLRDEYRKLKSPKAMAISESTGAFGIAAGDAAGAIKTCGAAGATDCKVVVAD
ncbi:hypothetical protein C8N43_0317 [Litoreibacter ponti]|uniref:5-aminolevulic acid synthase n=1 Tax=Litoreibacter ponti TaxID=1510457 RepID=A0A2T6BHY8_9RHOB|nr:5-aminolevulic acid synthase [Litoreibacter ponti]PTX55677.1 hypothetical protein C8N43_0317 [Litoreibacter ponti]